MSQASTRDYTSMSDDERRRRGQQGQGSQGQQNREGQKNEGQKNEGEQKGGVTGVIENVTGKAKEIAGNVASNDFMRNCSHNRKPNYACDLQSKACLADCTWTMSKLSDVSSCR